jgi:hypothetical protein
MNKEIGGYFEFDVSSKYSFHKDAIELNTARNCFEYILLAKKTKRVYLPHYICEVMLEPLKRNNIEFYYYYLDENLEPLIPSSMKSGDFFLYTNYFGIKQNTVRSLSSKLGNLIIDNSMAFYASPVKDVDTFYSARKFFGVPDGALLYTNGILDFEPEDDYSHHRMLHLFKRIESGANKAYHDFLENDLTLYNQPIRKMSVITKLILSGINYSEFKTIRERNFLFLHQTLERFNELQLNITDLNGPMFYPFLFNSEKLRNKLIENKIYVPMLWKNTLKTAKSNSFEHYLTKNLFALPIDQRYSLEDMKFILNTIGLRN